MARCAHRRSATSPVATDQRARWPAALTWSRRAGTAGDGSPRRTAGRRAPAPAGGAARAAVRCGPCARGHQPPPLHGPPPNPVPTTPPAGPVDNSSPPSGTSSRSGAIGADPDDVRGRRGRASGGGTRLRSSPISVGSKPRAVRKPVTDSGSGWPLRHHVVDVVDVVAPRPRASSRARMKLPIPRRPPLRARPASGSRRRPRCRRAGRSRAPRRPVLDPPPLVGQRVARRRGSQAEQLRGEIAQHARPCRRPTARGSSADPVGAPALRHRRSGLRLGDVGGAGR